jgi:selenocysteine lyase/cysteine desulfurase
MGCHLLFSRWVLLDILTETPGVMVYGINDTKRLEERLPTCAFTLNVGAGLETRPIPPRRVAKELDEANIFVWDGNYYALEVTTRQGLEETGGMVRRLTCYSVSFASHLFILH